MVAAPVEPAQRPNNRPLVRLNPDEPWLCFEDAKAWRVYLEGWRRSNTPCLDCTPDYQADMIAQGRCRYPETQFLEEDDQTIGYRDGRDKGRASRWKDR